MSSAPYPQERLDGRTVTLGDPLPGTPTLGTSDHVWDNPDLRPRDDYRHPLAQCIACGARLIYDAADRVVWYHPLPHGRPLVPLHIEWGAGSTGPGCVTSIPACRRGGDLTVRFPATLRQDPATAETRAAADAARRAFVRVDGRSLCPCGVVASWHPPDGVDAFLVVLCDGTRVKL